MKRLPNRRASISREPGDLAERFKNKIETEQAKKEMDDLQREVESFPQKTIYHA